MNSTILLHPHNANKPLGHNITNASDPGLKKNNI